MTALDLDAARPELYVFAARSVSAMPVVGPILAVAYGDAGEVTGWLWVSRAPRGTQ